MTKKRQKGFISWGRIMAIVVVTIALFLMVDFGRRAWDNYRLSREVKALEEEVTAFRAENKALKERLEYVGTDAYIEEAAREKLHWVQPGDTAIVVIPQKVEEAPSLTPPPAESIEKPNWQRWWDLFFGLGP